jgi:hypothetical protein
MDKKAIEAARQVLAKAKGHFASMLAAKSYAEFQGPWSDFLLAANRVYTKLEQGAKTDGKSVGWFGRMKHERRNDSLLRYIHHARNADEHGIEPITEHQRGGLEIKTGGQLHVKALTIDGGQIALEYTGDDPNISIVPDRAKLISVVDHGDTYPPPTSHKGTNLKDQSPAAVAQLSIAYLQVMIDEATKLTQ